MSTLRRVLAAEPQATPPALRRRLDEPVFPAGPGRHIVRDLVTDLPCGAIEAWSQPGRRTRFTLRISA